MMEELHSVLYNQVFLGFGPLALTVCHFNNDRLSFYPFCSMKETALVCKLVFTRMGLLYVYVCVNEFIYKGISLVVCAENPMITVLLVARSPKAHIY